ncbi:MAG: DUF2339 domain-containing protein [Alphaproteobacteria bacterium]
MNEHDRLSRIESRLAAIEQTLGISRPAPVPEIVAIAAQGPWVKATSSGENHFYPPASESKPGNWLGLVAIICFVLAAGFIVKLSIESGWLTPARQIGLAGMLGIGLIVSGLMLMRTDREYASLLPGAGVIILYLVSFAAHRYYGLVGFETALGAVVIISGLCLWLYTHIKHDIYAITAAAGAFVSPVLLGMNARAEFTLYYYVVCSVAFAILSIFLRSRLLTLVSAYLAIFMTAVVGSSLGQDRLIAMVLPFHFFVFAFGTYMYSRHHDTPLQHSEGWSFLPVLLSFYALEYYYIEQVAPGQAPWFSIGFAAILIALYLSARQQFVDSPGSRFLVYSFAAVVCFHSVYLELLPENLQHWLFVVILFAAAFVPARVKDRVDNAFGIPVLVVLLVLGLEYVSILMGLLGNDRLFWLPLSFAGLAGMWTLMFMQRDRFNTQTSRGNALLIAAHVLAIVALYRLTEDAGSLAVSASWLFYAVAVLAVAYTIADNIMLRSALFVLAFAAGKALLIDAASAPTVVRILCLLLTGGVLYGCGLMLRRFTTGR